MFNGTNNSGNGGGNYTGTPTLYRRSRISLPWLSMQPTNIKEESTTRYATKVMPQFAAAMPAGKIVLGYEGGTDWQTSAGGNQNGHVLTEDDALFANAVLNSPQWATAQVDFFNAVSKISNCFMPSIYIWIQGAGGKRWAYCTPDSYAVSGGVRKEGQALLNNPAWVAMSARNVALAI